MQSTIVLGDLHGLTYWENIVADNSGCRFIFLGDYLDPYEELSDNAIVSNLRKIIEFKANNPTNVILLLGNHDMHYLTSKITKATRYNRFWADKISQIFQNNMHLFQYAYQVNNHIFTHAGISHKWFSKNFQGDISRNIADQLNNPKAEQEKALFCCGEARGGLRGTLSGIFWADIDELSEPLPGYTQIVGHNRVDDIEEYTNNGGKIIFCDCLHNQLYLKIDI